MIELIEKDHESRPGKEMKEYRYGGRELERWEIFSFDLEIYNIYFNIF